MVVPHLWLEWLSAGPSMEEAILEVNRARQTGSRSLNLPAVATG